MNRIGLGRTSEMFEIDNTKALKLFYQNIPAEHIQIEYLMNKELSNTIAFIPKVYELIKKDNRTGIVYQLIKGINIGRYMNIHPNELSSTIKQFSLLHKKINETLINTQKIHIGSVEILIEKIQKSLFLDNTEKEIIKSFLLATDKKQLCHGDYHPENVMIDSEHKMWVIDWITSLACNEYFDIARTYYILRYGKSPEKKSIAASLFEHFVCMYLSRQYYKCRITDLKSHRMMNCYLYIVMILRLDDNIEEENKKLTQMVTCRKNKVLRMMNNYVPNCD